MNENLSSGGNCPECTYIGERRVRLCEKCDAEALHNFELCDHFGSRNQIGKSRRCAECQARIDKVFDEFWIGIVTDDQGSLDVEKVKAELSDFHTVIEQVTDVYLNITNGKFSKLTYDSDVIVSEVEKLQSKEISEAATEAVKNEKEEILAYLESRTEYYKLNRNAVQLLEEIVQAVGNNAYKPDFKEKQNDATGTDSDFILCRNCRQIAGSTADFRCANCGEAICATCGCTDSAACEPPCEWTRPGRCSNCESKNEK